MIPSLMNSDISFQAKKLKSARDAYSNKIEKNQELAQRQLKMNNQTQNSQLNKPILMQGQGEKLDVTI